MSQCSRKILLPYCFPCMRSIFQLEPSLFASPFRIQVRGKKKKVKLPPTIIVKLLEDVRFYGRKGAIIPVKPGRMRNALYPFKLAEYVTDAQLQTLPDVVVERDLTFGQKPNKKRQKASIEVAHSVRGPRISPQRATQLLSEHLPELLKFYRTPIPTSEQDKAEHTAEESPSREAMTASDSNLASASKLVSKQQHAAIYGSVSTSDITTSVQALIDLETAKSQDAARLVINAEDIKIVYGDGTEAGDEVDKIKTLGRFKVSIQVKGGEPVQRDILVMEQEQSNTTV